MREDFHIKKKIVESGSSAIFNEWTRLTNGAFTMEDFVNGLEWLCSDPCDGGISGDKLTRELVLDLSVDAYNKEMSRRMTKDERLAYGSLFTYDEHKVDGSLIRANRVYSDIPGAPMVFSDDNGRPLSTLVKISISARDRI